MFEKEGYWNYYANITIDSIGKNDTNVILSTLIPDLTFTGSSENSGEIDFYDRKFGLETYWGESYTDRVCFNKTTSSTTCGYANFWKISNWRIAG